MGEAEHGLNRARCQKKDLATDFFERQDQARRHTSRLVVLFGLAVFGIMLLLYGLAVLTVGFKGQDPYTGAPVWAIQWLDPALFLQVAIGTGLLVGGASLFRMAQLRGGGHTVAEAMGGRLLHGNSREPVERKILNIVEEMSIASGTPTPPVYLLDQEPGINAFAAGYSVDDAVLGITRGCAERLSRDELQGVVAHEFSHILNGDMRLNIRLMGVLYGILVIGFLGYMLLRSSFWSGAMRRRNSKDNSALAMLAIGVALMAIGFVGTFFGNLIKASVSRQREFLADASAVQFTRNPAGIAGALKKIGGLDVGATINNPNAAEVSHFFFGRAIESGLSSLFSTHPPLEERIARLDPGWAPSANRVVNSGSSDAEPVHPGVAGFAAGRSDRGLDQIGQVTTAHLDYAHQLIAGLPRQVLDAAHEPYGARAVVYALLIGRDQPTQAVQLEQMPHIAEPDVWELALQLRPHVAGLDPKVRLPLLDLTLPALRELSPSQFKRFRSGLVSLIEADRKVELFEWTLQRVLLTHLKSTFEPSRPPRAKYKNLSRVTRPCSVILSALARASGGDPEEIERAFQAGRRSLGFTELEWLPPEASGFSVLDEALKELSMLTATRKRDLLTACAHVICADQEIGIVEAELFRAIADTLECPFPPLLAGQPLT